ncbi:hypothetical protein K502DRAFT_348978 [Neoconidiobolus thromboides FSU 785]|nr:hypothetical protein K502DRAFT_348978 [Neoconidiobolus thromboides FSU 785]
MDNIDVESGKLNQSPPSYMGIGSSHSNQTILIRQPEILELSRRGVAILVCPFENKEVTTKLKYKLNKDTWIYLFYISLISLMILSESDSYTAALLYFLTNSFIFLIGILDNNRYDEIHLCSSCDRVVAIAKENNNVDE